METLKLKDLDIYLRTHYTAGELAKINLRYINDDSIDLQEMAKLLNITTMGVWKRIKSLKERGIVVNKKNIINYTRKKYTIKN